MSMHPYVNMGYGYELDIADDDLFYGIVALFPEQAKPYQDEDGEIKDFNGFLYGVSENFRVKYRDLNFVIVSDDYTAASFLVVDRETNKDLYDKYGSNDSGVIRPQSIYSEASEALKKFSEDVNIKSDPEILIWTYWS